MVRAIFRINAFTEYRRSSLYIARLLNLATTLWNKINSSPVRRSSSCSISSGRSRHFAALRNSLISLALGPRRRFLEWPRPWHWSVPRPARRGIRAAGLARTRFSHCRNVSVLPKKLTVCDCDNSGPSHNFAQLVCTSQQTQCMLSLLLSTLHEKVIASLCGKNSTEMPRLGKILQSPKT